MNAYQSYRAAVRMSSPGIQRLWRRIVPTPIRRALRAACRVSHEQIPDTLATSLDGRTFHIGPDPIYIPLHHGQAFEPEATEMVRQIVRKGDVIVDAGANFGWYATLFGELVGETGKVHAFEPVPPTFARLCENLNLNKLADIVMTNNCALGDQEGEVEVHLFEEMSHSLASLSQACGGSSTPFAAKLNRLDDYLSSSGVDRVNFLKCDVEGSELMVLKGAKRLLAGNAAPTVMVELNADTSAAFGYKPRDIIQYLRSTGYDHAYEIESTTKLKPLPDCDDPQFQRIDLVLACKGDRLEHLT